MEDHTNSTGPEIDGRLIGTAVLAADMWAITEATPDMTAAERTRGIVETAVMHLIEQGLLAVPDDLAERLDRPLPVRRHADGGSRD